MEYHQAPSKVHLIRCEIIYTTSFQYYWTNIVSECWIFPVAYGSQGRFDISISSKRRVWITDGSPSLHGKTLVQIEGMFKSVASEWHNPLMQLKLLHSGRRLPISRRPWRLVVTGMLLGKISGPRKVMYLRSNRPCWTFSRFVVNTCSHFTYWKNNTSVRHAMNFILSSCGRLPSVLISVKCFSRTK